MVKTVDIIPISDSLLDGYGALNGAFNKVLLNPTSRGPLIQLISPGGYFYLKLELRTVGPQKLMKWPKQ